MLTKKLSHSRTRHHSVTTKRDNCRRNKRVRWPTSSQLHPLQFKQKWEKNYKRHGEREEKIEKNINTVWTRERNLLYTTGQAAFPAPSNLTQKNQQPPPPPSFQPSSMLWWGGRPERETKRKKICVLREKMRSFSHQPPFFFLFLLKERKESFDVHWEGTKNISHIVFLFFN